VVWNSSGGVVWNSSGGVVWNSSGGVVWNSSGGGNRNPSVQIEILCIYMYDSPTVLRTSHLTHLWGIACKYMGDMARQRIVTPHVYIYEYTRVSRVERRGLQSRGGNLIHRKFVFCIFRCESIWVGISGDTLEFHNILEKLQIPKQSDIT